MLGMGWIYFQKKLRIHQSSLNFLKNGETLDFEI
jgi:hypothetical protein